MIADRARTSWLILKESGAGTAVFKCCAKFMVCPTNVTSFTELGCWSVARRVQSCVRIVMPSI